MNSSSCAATSPSRSQSAGAAAYKYFLAQQLDAVQLIHADHRVNIRGLRHVDECTGRVCRSARRRTASAARRGEHISLAETPQTSAAAAMTAAMAQSSDLKLFHCEDIGPSYASTLAAWRERFHRRLAIRALAGLERLELDPERALRAVEPGVGCVVEGLVAPAADVVAGGARSLSVANSGRLGWVRDVDPERLVDVQRSGDGDQALGEVGVDARVLFFQADGLFKAFGAGTFIFGFAFTLFEILVSVLQAYVFTLLTTVYIQLALADEH